MEHVHFYKAQIDKELEKYPQIVKLEKQTGVPKAYAAVGAGALFFFLVFFNIFADFICNLIGFVYPAYMSYHAIESPAHDDDKQWLTYWVVFGFLNMIEFFSDVVLYWFPFYYTFKVIGLFYLMAPQFEGAKFVYDRFLRQFLIQASEKVEKVVNDKKE